LALALLPSFTSPSHFLKIYWDDLSAVPPRAFP
jgi:hypothetical protein